MPKTQLWKHFAAFVYDVFPILGIVIITSGCVLIIRGGNATEPYTWWFMLLIYCEIAFYYIYFWKKGGQTIGMKSWKLKIIPNNNQTHLTWKQSILRFIAGLISTLFLGLGLFWRYFSKNKNTWMDSISHSTTGINEV